MAMFQLQIDNCAKTAVYKQIITGIQKAIESGELKEGDMIPSMNSLSSELNISMETVKKSYYILRKKGLIEGQQGKGFFVADRSCKSKISVLFILDKLSTYKQETVNAFLREMGEGIECSILIFNQNIDLFEYFIDENVGKFDYYIVSPHFQTNAATQARVRKGLRRLPFQKLIIIDNPTPELPGKYGAIYQDYDNDAYNCLTDNKEAFADIRRIIVITLRTSLYGKRIQAGVERFCKENGIICSCRTDCPSQIRSGDVFVMLNSQLDSGLIALVKAARKKNLSVGQDYFLISYNESPIDEVVLNGLTTISTDFAQMGSDAAGMIKAGGMRKMHNNFRMIRRATF